MSSRASSSRSSSPSSSHSDGEDEVDTAARLGALERLLQSSLGYDTEPVDEAPPAEEDGEDAVMEAAAPPVAKAADVEEVVAFRLFSTQRAPVNIIVREKEDEAGVDPRIRAVEDESKSVVKQRRRDIASIAVEGATIRSQASTEPLTKYATRVTTRILEKRKSVLPTLAYFNAVLPPPFEPSTSRPIASSRPKRRRPKPLDPLRVKLLVAPIVKAEVKAALLRGRPSVKSTIGGKRTRLSKARRAIARKRSLEVMKK